MSFYGVTEIVEISVPVKIQCQPGQLHNAIEWARDLLHIECMTTEHGGIHAKRAEDGEIIAPQDAWQTDAGRAEHGQRDVSDA